MILNQENQKKINWSLKKDIFDKIKEIWNPPA